LVFTPQHPSRQDFQPYSKKFCQSTRLKTGIANLPIEQIWVNPDCGLKTRRWEEVIPSLKNMVEAAKIIREENHATKE
jgi:hypothetical protein